MKRKMGKTQREVYIGDIGVQDDMIPDGLRSASFPTSRRED